MHYTAVYVLISFLMYTPDGDVSFQRMIQLLIMNLFFIRFIVNQFSYFISQ